VETEVFLDTHVIVWLYAGELARLSPKTKKCLESPIKLLASPMALLEVDYLYEVKMIRVRHHEVVEELREKIGLEIADDSFASILREASSLSWTRDPFDRLIVAHAQLRSLPLMTKDRTIRRHFTQGFW
jgi:PIN domain nuclease of toxin-antitoxin system